MEIKTKLDVGRLVQNEVKNYFDRCRIDTCDAIHCTYNSMHTCYIKNTIIDVNGKCISFKQG